MIEVAHRTHSVCIELCRADRANAFSADMVEALIEAVGEVLTDPPALLVFKGAGRHFCAGFDFAALDDESDASLVHRFLRIEQLLQLIHGAPCCTLALGHGSVAGAGADLFAACTRRIAAPDSSFRFPGARFGALLGTARLMRLIGPHAQAVVLGQQTLSAASAYRIGLADGLAAPAQWEELIDRLAEAAASVPPEAARQIAALRREHQDADMGQLAVSISSPGLKQRMSTYWRQVRTPGAGRQACPQ